MNSTSYIKQDVWLSSTLERPCYNLNATEFLKSKDSLSTERGSLIQSKVNCDDINAVIYLQKKDFQLIDTNVTYELNTETIESDFLEKNYQFILAEPQHQKEVYHCAKKSFIYTRYHLDPKIPNPQADLIKAEWANNFFNGQRGQKMVLALSDTVVVGFCQILEPEPTTRVIDLIAVASDHRRKGLAGSMIKYALEKENRILVGTQVNNIPSIRCYEAMGFRVSKSQYVFHLHT